MGNRKRVRTLILIYYYNFYLYMMQSLAPGTLKFIHYLTIFTAVNIAF